MKISLNWLKEYVDINLSTNEIEHVLTAIGLEVEGMTETMSGPDLTGVIVGHVLTCGKHPGADKLSVTTVDVGAGEALHIVCGAPNVAAGQKVMVATIGTILPTDDDSIFKIKKGNIRGEVSEGMLCAEDELGTGHSHEGILVLPAETAIGTSAEEYFKFERDVIIEIGLTPNRSDATCHLGVAEDLLAYLKVNEAYANNIKKPDVSSFTSVSGTPITVEVKDFLACPRYSGILLENVEVKPSPDWIQNRLRAIGVRPISNIVDITNFILHELGQPLHAFDADEIKGNKVIVQQLPQDTIFKSLDEKDRKLHQEDLIICDGDNNGMCIAGVFGGLKSGVKDKTTRIFLESAHFTASSLRRTSFRHLLRTDAAMVFEKGSDPNNTVYALKRAVQLMQQYANATVVSEIIDVYPNPIEKKQITSRFDKVRSLIGGEIKDEEILNILAALNMDVSSNDGTNFTVSIPTNKADVTREVDLVEEILRIYGFNKVALPGYIHSAIQTRSGVDSFRIKNDIANLLTGAGFSEMMGLSLVDIKYVDESYTDVVTINNTSNITLNIMRPTLAHTALETVLNNQNRQQLNLRMFENGRSYKKTTDGFHETDQLALTIIGDQLGESWMNTKGREISFYDLKAYVQMILTKLGIVGYQVRELENEGVFDSGLSYHRGPNEIVQFGMLQEEMIHTYGVKKQVFHAVFNWEVIFRFMAKSVISVAEITKFPVMRRDLALVVDKSVKFDDIYKIATKTEKNLLKEVNLFDVYTNDDQLGASKKSYAVSFSFEHLERTLNDKEITKIMDILIQKYEKELLAVVRK